jgi:hypothetical protein
LRLLPFSALAVVLLPLLSCYSHLLLLLLLLLQLWQHFQPPPLLPA